jgi:crossover junction endodeoxyribonuclease RuvC
MIIPKRICILGCDPGISGAIAFYFPETQERVIAEDIMVVAGHVACVSMADRIAQLRPDIAVIEGVGAMQGWGTSSTFKFGCAYGSMLGIIAAQHIPFHIVSPSVWKKYWKLDRDKEKSRALALRLFPICASQFARKKDHNKAEAALLARYGAETIFK